MNRRWRINIVEIIAVTVFSIGIQFCTFKIDKHGEIIADKNRVLVSSMLAALTYQADAHFIAQSLAIIPEDRTIQDMPAVQESLAYMEERAGTTLEHEFPDKEYEDLIKKMREGDIPILDGMWRLSLKTLILGGQKAAKARYLADELNQLRKQGKGWHLLRGFFFVVQIVMVTLLICGQFALNGPLGDAPERDSPHKI